MLAQEGQLVPLLEKVVISSVGNNIALSSAEMTLFYAN